MIPSNQVSIGSSSSNLYTTGQAMPAKGTAIRSPQEQPQQSQPSGVLGSQVVRATGSGPFDAAYRQNLATYTGGQFQRPGGVLAFNPTAPFMGNPGGSPSDFITQALGGGGYSTPQPPQQPQATGTPIQRKPIWQQPDWQQWLGGLTRQGGLLRGY
jgi:hypothetical protein